MTPRLKARRFLANFDSMTAMLVALARFHRGKGIPMMGMAPFSPPIGPLVDALPRSVSDWIYAWGGVLEARAPRRMGSLRAEDVARWMTSLYPRRRYPAVAVGSANGAAVHLWAALGVPWLPQTFLAPVRVHGVHPDEPKEAMAWAREPAMRLLEANPELQLHHMHDPSHDRLMLRGMAYFRLKRLRLGEAFTRFIERSLAPDGRIFVVDCGLRWPATRVGERHFFQMGAPGGTFPEEFLRGGPRVAEFLRRYGSHRTRWDAPEKELDAPEAEWGFEPALLDDVESLARRRGYRVQRVSFLEPEALSPLVADLYRWRYRRRGLPCNRLLVESFALVEPFWALRTGCAPFWTKFPMEPSARRLERYLEAAEPFDEIYATLFSHGTESVGLAPPERWEPALSRARRKGAFLGVHEDRFPRDFGVFFRFHRELKALPSRYPIPGPLSLAELDAFLEGTRGRYEVDWYGTPVRQEEFEFAPS